ncbi:FAD-NAD(P)-binding domain-containing protein [Ditylenchus destructor]|uniref:FAD-NAD(P)-binding domain-containing protein n=1 Tax=Ditylenchus destructor TaxID=166010 RepID=A0AAD4QTV8_9BILA|nr:FAD-NAD(P)-binding domain-containing protein [Ditylenchus destructor]
MDPVYRIGVIGGGASGTAFIAQLNTKLRACLENGMLYERVEVIVIERSAQVGPGYAYAIDPTGDSFRLNRCKDSIDAIADETGLFSKWVREHGDEDAKQNDFPLRSAFGKYLVYLVEEVKRSMSESGGRLKLELITQTGVDDIVTKKAYYQKKQKYVIHCSNLDTHASFVREVDTVVLCTGHYPTGTYREFNHLPNYSHNNPSHKRLMRELAADCSKETTVGIIGANLTAIDIAVEMKRLGFAGKIVMSGRHDLLPAAGEPISVRLLDKHKNWTASRKTSICQASVNSKGTVAIDMMIDNLEIGRKDPIEEMVMPEELLCCLSSIENGDGQLKRKKGFCPLIESYEWENEPSLKVKYIGLVGLTENQRKYSSNRSFVCDSPLSNQRHSSKRASIVTIGPTPRSSVDEDEFRHYHLTHLNLDEIPRPVRITDVVTRFFRELSDLEGRTITVESATAYYQTHTALECLEEQIATAERGAINCWQLLIFTMAPLIEQLWSELSDEEKAIYWRDYHHLFMRHIIYMPLINARQVRDMMVDEQLVYMGKLEPITQAQPARNASIEPTRRFVMSGMQDDTYQRYEVDYLFNATGYTGSPKDMPMYTKMLERGEVVCHKHGGLCLDRPTLQTQNADGKINSGMYAVGELTKGYFFTAADMPTVATQTDNVANAITAQLSRRNNTLSA